MSVVTIKSEAGTLVDIVDTAEEAINTYYVIKTDLPKIQIRLQQMGKEKIDNLATAKIMIAEGLLKRRS